MALVEKEERDGTAIGTTLPMKLVEEEERDATAIGATLPMKLVEKEEGDGTSTGTTLPMKLVEKEEKDGTAIGATLPMKLVDTQEGDGTAIRATIPKKRSFSIFRAALFMIRRRRSTKKTPIHTDLIESGALNLVSSIRPLHHVTPNPPVPLLPPPAPPEFHDVPLPPQSPMVGDDDGMSRYASAEDLLALDTCVEEEEEENGNAIDVKAEEFIAKFYEQMKMQRLDSFNSNNEMIEEGA